MLQNPFETLGDGALEQNLLALARSERGLNADIILHLVVVKSRKLHVPAGFDSLFAYCTGRLGFSKSAAFRRKVVADKAAEFPALIDRLRDGRLHLCAAAAIAAELRPESAENLLDAVVGLSHREVEAFLVKQWRVRAPAPQTAAAPQPALVANVRKSSNVGTALTFDAPAVPTSSLPLQRTIVKPVSQHTNRVNVTLSDKTLANLKRAKEILGQHADDEVLCKALEKLLDHIAPERRHARREKRQAAPEKAPRQSAAASQISAQVTATAPAPEAAAAKAPASKPGPRRARAAIRDQVTVAAHSQCSFVSKNGHRCEARIFLEIDHIKPWALGGASTADNQRPLCRAHNAYLAEQTFGPWRGAHKFPGEAPRSR